MPVSERILHCINIILHVWCSNNFIHSFIYSSSHQDTFVRPMYAGNVLGKVAIKDPNKRKVLSIRPTAFDKAPLMAVGEVVTTEVQGFEKAKWVGEAVSKSDRPDLQSATTVVSGGRGIKVRKVAVVTVVVVRIQ